MNPPPRGVTACCCICGERVSFADPDDDVCCGPCFTLNLAQAVHLEAPVVRPTLGRPTRDAQAVRNYQRHVARVEGTGPCVPLVREEEPHGEA